MRQLKYLVTYGSFVVILERHPEVLAGYRDALEEVQAAMKHEFEQSPAEWDGLRGLIHEPNRLVIIDWENIQYGHRAVNIGGMLADLYERHHFNGGAASLPVLEGFVEGYSGGGPLLLGGSNDEELAFRVATHAGVHLICWYYRRDRNGPLLYPLQTVLAALVLGRDLVLKGWKRDKEWLATTFLAPLFMEGNSNQILPEPCRQFVSRLRRGYRNIHPSLTATQSSSSPATSKPDNSVDVNRIDSNSDIA
ncbi:hypothetical protein PG994_010299 [Apiospora phragmitis]|uniref:Uncharacterized protein n=1 Tax=Apiospora phragmitis TaxID=2905665 RepID=A0ABR1TPI0_9PEZI